MAKTNVTIIPANIEYMQNGMANPAEKRRVAAYARVSTDSEEQENSYFAQCDYYEKYIQNRPEWEFVSLYSDEGITGCNTKKREGFKSMIADALAGKIDLIITKSVSRFARNTVDSLQTIRKLKDHGVECYFEKEQIWTFDGKGELLITIMSSLAQEEARGISQNVTWGKRRSFEEGRVSLPYKNFLGYEKGEDGKPKIVEEEAKIIRWIFDLYLQGKTINVIANMLTSQGIPTPGCKTVWGVPTVNSILRNEKYAGNARLQKTFTTNYLTKEIKKNEGEIPSYWVEGSHPAIVDPVIFDLVQEEIEKNKAQGKKRRAGQIFSSMVYCGDCKTGIFGSKTWGVGTPYRRRVWQCNEKYRVKGEVNCNTPAATDDELKRAVVAAFNRILKDKDDYIDAYISVAESLTNIERQESEIALLTKCCTDVYAQIETLVRDNAGHAQNQTEYNERYTDLAARYKSHKERLSVLEDEKNSKLLRRQKILAFLDNLREQNGLLQDFEEGIFRSMADHMTVYSKRNISVTFKDGNEVHVDLTVE